MIEGEDRRNKDDEFLKSYINHLETKIKDVQNHIDLLKSDLLRLEDESQGLKREIEHLNEVPLLTGEIEDILDESKNRLIVKTSSGISYIVNTTERVKQEDLSPGLQIALNQRNFAAVEILPTKLDPFIKGMELLEKNIDVAYGDIGGLDDQIQEVRETVELPLLKPELFKRVGIEPPNGVLFYGAPGTGKTLLAKAVASETNATFIRIIAAELVQKFIGEGARYVREIFKLAKDKAPSIIFIDELDAIGATRMEDATSGDREVNRTLMQLLSELDGFDERKNVKFIGATNRADILDPALLRAGRFDRLIEFPLPNPVAREAIFKIHMRSINMETTIDLKKIVDLTEGGTGADIKAICIEAGMFAIRRNSEMVTYEDLLKAVEKVKNKSKEVPLTSDFFT
ncbi:MAG: AAA family ATPase [Candidatus Lokiarchaeota archaeon]|nr:AAA family ATPase [Candidatus Lokiarchaeota archaeon]